MREPKSIVSYQTTEYGHVKVTLCERDGRIGESPVTA